MGLIPETYHIQIVVGKGLGLLFGFVVQLHGGKGQIFQHRHMGVQVELLKNHAHIVTDQLALVFMGHLLTGNEYLAGGGLFQKVHAADRGGFSAAGGADDDQLFSLGYGQVHIFQYVQISEHLIDIFQPNHFIHSISPQKRAL